MGRNKDIKLLHEITGKPYRECRALMKANGWCFVRALAAGGMGYILSPAVVDAAIEAFVRFGEAAKTAADTLTEILNDFRERIIAGTK